MDGQPSQRGPRPLLTLMGFPVYVPVSAWLGIALIAYVNAPAFRTHGGTVATVAFAVGLYLTVLVHELAHALTARATGHHVVAITLGVLGGATLYDASTRPNPKHELRVALAGPLSSVLLGLLLVVGAPAAPGEATQAVVLLLGSMNVELGILNLLPAAPLDGGHVCEALVWRITHSRRRGMRATAVLGVLLGCFMLSAGLASSNLVVGQLLIFFGLMLVFGAGTQWRMATRFR